jgi:hypothetical protein
VCTLKSYKIISYKQDINNGTTIGMLRKKEKRMEMKRKKIPSFNHNVGLVLTLILILVWY